MDFEENILKRLGECTRKRSRYIIRIRLPEWNEVRRSASRERKIGGMDDSLVGLCAVTLKKYMGLGLMGKLKNRLWEMDFNVGL